MNARITKRAGTATYSILHGNQLEEEESIWLQELEEDLQNTEIKWKGKR